MKRLRIQNLIIITVLCSGQCFLYAAQAHDPEQINPILSGLLETSEHDSELKDIQDLVAQGVSVLGKTAEGDTALMLAINNDNPKIAQLLLETIERQKSQEALQKYVNASTAYSEDPNSGHTALAIAASKGDLASATLLLAKGAQKSIEIPITEGDTPLMLAALHNHIDIVNLLLQHGAHINAQDNHDRTALMYAAKNNNLNLVALLLEKGADYTLEDDDLKHAYDHAHGYPAVQKLLANYEAKMKTARENQPAIKIALEQHVLPPLANIIEEYALPHAQEERELI